MYLFLNVLKILLIFDPNYSYFWLVLEKFGVWFDTYMRRGNLPDLAHDKVTWKRRDRRNNVARRRGGVVPQQSYWVFHLRFTGEM